MNIAVEDKISTHNCIAGWCGTFAIGARLGVQGCGCPRAVLGVVIIAMLAAIGHAQPVQTEEESIRALIRTFAAARNAHDSAAVAAIYSEDGEWIASSGLRTVRGRPALAHLWGDLPGQVQRTIQSIDFAGGNIAVVRVDTNYSEPVARHHEVFIFVKDHGTWNIRVHQSLE